MKSIEVKTTWGTIRLTLDNGAVTGCSLPPLKTAPRQPFSFSGGTGPSAFAKASADRPGAFKACAPRRIEGLRERPLHPKEFFQWLEKKFPTIGKPAGTEFQQAVWNELRNIPRGQTRTYGEIAAAIGHPKAVRAVGSACGANPIPLFIPCHRAVAKNGIGGFSCGLPWKRFLLELEGWNGGTME